MPFFAMICSCSMLLSCSKLCFLMLIPSMLLFSPSLWTWYLLHVRHACLDLLLCDLAVAQCSSFVKHLEWITAMCFVAMLECSSLVYRCILDGIVLLIAESCHYCFACHLQTVHPISAHLVCQVEAWFNLFLPEQEYALHSTSRISCHVLHHVVCALHRGWFCFPCLCSCLG